MLEFYYEFCNWFVVGFIGLFKMNFLEGIFVEFYGSYVIGIWLEYFVVFCDIGDWIGVVMVFEYLGFDIFFYVVVEGMNDLIIVCVMGEVGFRYGDIVYIMLE